MAKARYTMPGVASSITANTPKTVISVLSPAQFGCDVVGFEISFEGGTSTAKPARWELCQLSGATAGTSTAVTPVQVSGRTITAGFTGGTNYSAEPTVLTVVLADYMPVFGGLLKVEFNTYQGYDNAVSTGYALRITTAAAEATVNANGTLIVERC